jgi:hypothetical protein
MPVPAASRTTTLLVLLCVGATCVRHDPPQGAGGSSAAPCSAVDSSARQTYSPEQIAGDYRLTLVATSGRRSGQSVSGSLRVGPRFGRASIALDSVGAVAAGDIGSSDPSRPGVLVLAGPNQTGAAGKAMLRFGADANDASARRFDGAHMVLVVDTLSTTVMAGRWRSGGTGVGNDSASGFFCAARAP